MQLHNLETPLRGFQNQEGFAAMYQVVVQKHLCAYVKNCITDTATIGEEPDEPLSIESSVILKELVGYSVL